MDPDITTVILTFITLTDMTETENTKNVCASENVTEYLLVPRH